jgi:hypothetical protein
MRTGESYHWCTSTPRDWFGFAGWPILPVFGRVGVWTFSLLLIQGLVRSYGRGHLPFVTFRLKCDVEERFLRSGTAKSAVPQVGMTKWLLGTKAPRSQIGGWGSRKVKGQSLTPAPPAKSRSLTPIRERRGWVRDDKATAKRALQRQRQEARLKAAATRTAARGGRYKGWGAGGAKGCPVRNSQTGRDKTCGASGPHHGWGVGCAQERGAFNREKSGGTAGARRGNRGGRSPRGRGGGRRCRRPPAS